MSDFQPLIVPRPGSLVMVVPILGPKKTSHFPLKALTCQIEEGPDFGEVCSPQSVQSAGKLSLLRSSPEIIILTGVQVLSGCIYLQASEVNDSLPGVHRHCDSVSRENLWHRFLTKHVLDEQNLYTEKR